MFSLQEREIVRQSLLEWPPHRAHLFMRTVLRRGRPVNTERKALCILRENPETIRFGSPEVVLADVRKELTFAGIERAFRDLTAYCRKRSPSFIYMELLDHNPEFLVTLFDDKWGVMYFGP